MGLTLMTGVCSHDWPCSELWLECILSNSFVLLRKSCDDVTKLIRCRRMRLHPKHEDTPCASTEDFLPWGWLILCWAVVFCGWKVICGDCKVDLLQSVVMALATCRGILRCTLQTQTNGKKWKAVIQWWAADIQHPFSEKSWRDLFCIPHRSEQQLNCTSKKSALE